MSDEPSNQEKFARLLALSKLQEARVKANPIPFLDEMASENSRLRRAMEEAIYHLSGASSFDLASEALPDRHPGIVETVTLRNRKAEDVLAKALRSANEPSR